jgi:hypothetical protein
MLNPGGAVMTTSSSDARTSVTSFMMSSSAALERMSSGMAEMLGGTPSEERFSDPSPLIVGTRGAIVRLSFSDGQTTAPSLEGDGLPSSTLGVELVSALWLSLLCAT